MEKCAVFAIILWKMRHLFRINEVMSRRKEARTMEERLLTESEEQEIDEINYEETLTECETIGSY